MSQIFSFLDALHGGIGDGAIELRALPMPNRERDLVPIVDGRADGGRIGRFVECARFLRLDAYCGVALRGRHYTDYQALTALFVDLDFKEHTEDTVRASLAEFPHAPTLVVASGNGLHAYWRLDTPIDLTMAYAEAKAALAVFARAFVVADVAVSEPARILRLPGTLNYKYEPARDVVLEMCDASRVYDVEALVRTAESIVIARDRAGLPDWLGDDTHLNVAFQPFAMGPRFEMPDRVGSGSRHATLFRLIRSLKARGVSEAEAWDRVQEENARCTPPLDLASDAERRWFRRSWRTADRPDFGTAPSVSAAFLDEVFR